MTSLSERIFYRGRHYDEEFLPSLSFVDDVAIDIRKRLAILI